MKKAVLAVAAILVLGGLVSWRLYWRARSAEAEAEVETEIAVRVGHITRATLREYVTAYGVVAPEPPGATAGGSARVMAAEAGLVTRVACAEGQRVAQGALLFQLDSRLADAAAARARSALKVAEAALERQRQLIQGDGTSQKALLEAEQAAAAARSELNAAETLQAQLRVVAPVAGTVAHIGVRPGEAVDSTTTLAELVDAARLVVDANVPSAELDAVHVGQTAEVRADLSTAPLRAAVTFVGPEVDVKTGTALVRAALSTPAALRPGQFVALRIVTVEHKDRLAVPIASLTTDSEGATVIALVRAGRAVQQAISAGLRDGELVEVQADGLAEGMPVVTEGAYGLPKETKIRVLQP